MTLQSDGKSVSTDPLTKCADSSVMDIEQIISARQCLEFFQTKKKRLLATHDRPAKQPVLDRQGRPSPTDQRRSAHSCARRSHSRFVQYPRPVMNKRPNPLYDNLPQSPSVPLRIILRSFEALLDDHCCSDVRF